MKLTAIMGVGTYYVPWTPYVLASTYFADEIVVVNGGLDINALSYCEYNIPLEKVSRDISNLDVDDKIVEVTDFSLGDLKHRTILTTQYDADQNDLKEWYDLRGLSATLATEVAQERGANVILYVQSDQPLYKNAMKIKDQKKSFMFYQYEFAGDIYHLADPGPDSPYDDAAFTFFPSKRNWFYGGCAPVIKGPRKHSQYNCAHLRHANPRELTEKECFEHFYGRLWFRYFTNEGFMGPQLDKRAKDSANTLLKDVWHRTIPSDIPPPEVCKLGPSRYIEEVIK